MKSGTLHKGAGDDELVDVKVVQAVPSGSDTKADRAVAPRAQAAAKREKAQPPANALECGSRRIKRGH